MLSEIRKWQNKKESWKSIAIVTLRHDISSLKPWNAWGHPCSGSAASSHTLQPCTHKPTFNFQFNSRDQWLYKSSQQIFDHLGQRYHQSCLKERHMTHEGRVPVSSLHSHPLLTQTHHNNMDDYGVLRNPSLEIKRFELCHWRSRESGTDWRDKSFLLALEQPVNFSRLQYCMIRSKKLDHIPFQLGHS